MTDASRWKATVYVGGLGPQVTTGTLHDAFLPFGDIAEVTLPKNDKPDAQNSSHRGFAYVEFEDVDDAKEAIDNMDKSEIFGRVIKVTPAKAPKSTSESLGSRTALWKQEGWLAENASTEEDRLAAEQNQAPIDEIAEDPMQGLEDLDVAGPRPE